VKAFADNGIRDEWIMNPQMFRPSSYVTALKMRANLAGNKVALTRAKIKTEVVCRRCRAQTETLGHILGQSIATKNERIKRHDDIKDYLLNRPIEENKEAVVTREPTLRSSEEGVLKPDMVIKNRRGVFVVDVTVRHEDGDYLRVGRKKLDKYQCLLPDLKQMRNGKVAAVIPIVIGTRRALPKEIIEHLKKLNIMARKDLLTISLKSFRRSIELYNHFMENNAPPSGLGEGLTDGWGCWPTCCHH
jgi:hypothetical protein